MIWDHIKVQVDNAIHDSPYQFIEFKESLFRDEWYTLEPFDRWSWGMGHKSERMELTFSQMVGFWRCEGHTTSQISERMEHLRNQISLMVDELMRIDEEEVRHDLMVEANEMVPEVAA